MSVKPYQGARNNRLSEKIVSPAIIGGRRGSSSANLFSPSVRRPEVLWLLHMATAPQDLAAPPVPALLEKDEERELNELAGRGRDSQQIVGLVDKLLELAVNHGASDVHLEPQRDGLIARYRVDGALYDAHRLPHAIREPLAARLKILTDLKIDERRVPQDGRFSAKFGERSVDFRVSTIPLITGEKFALRVLPQETKQLSLEELGLSPQAAAVVGANLRKPYGMLLVCGPTGSGKTTTLYTIIQTLLRERGLSSNLTTIEDPVEYAVERINQLQINPAVGLTFNTALRGLLRQDTDVIMVGEIRDRETAEAATQASLTGRLLLSSLHTRDAVGALIRLLEIGIEPYLVASAVTVVIAQRLVRVVCLKCSAAYTPDAESYKDLVARHNLAGVLSRVAESGKVNASSTSAIPQLFKGQGCPRCRYTGYRGRTAIFEVLEVSDAMRELIQQRTSSTLLRAQALKEHMVTMLQDGFVKALSGRTTLEEVLRVTLE